MKCPECGNTVRDPGGPNQHCTKCHWGEDDVVRQVIGDLLTPSELTKIKGRIGLAILAGPPAEMQSRTPPPSPTSEAQGLFEKIAADARDLADAFRKWEAMKTDPTLKHVFQHPDLGPALDGKFQDFILEVLSRKRK